MKPATDKIKVWPEMVLMETLAAIVATIALILVSMYFNAPLENIADPATSTNPSKAPWYFLGLQELLVYFSPWIAGVLVPTGIILGMAAIPYLDVKENAASGANNFVLHKNIKTIFTGGLILWIILTVTGIYLRGPNWHLQWPDGTPMGANAAVLSISWLIPAITVGYILFILLRIQRFQNNIQKIGWPRCLAVHAMILSELIIVIKISLYTVLSL